MGELFGLDTVVALILVLVAALLITIGVASNFGFIRNLQTCPEEGKPIPQWMFWCKEREASYYDEVALDSVRGLVCAVNAAGTGSFSTSSCPGETVKASLLPGVLAQSSQERCFGQTCVSCDVYQSAYAEIEYEEDNNVLTGDQNNVWYWWDGGEWKWKSPDLATEDQQAYGKYGSFLPLQEFEDLKDALTAAGKTLLDVDIDEHHGKVVEVLLPDKNHFLRGLNHILSSAKFQPDDFLVIHYETGATRIFSSQEILYPVGYNEDITKAIMPDKRIKQCSIRNFQLPQDIDAKVLGLETYILYFGLPERLVYWQQFPLDEDTWSETSDFAFYSVLSTFVFVGPLRSLKFIGKAASKLPGLRAVVGNRFVSGAALRVAAVRGWIAAKVSQSVFLSTAAKLSKTTTAIATGAGRVAIGAYLALGYEAWKFNMEKTMEEYLKTHRNEIVFLKALKGKEGGDFPLAGELKDKPVLLQWVPGYFANEEKSLHFVSPCDIATMTVAPALVGCWEYLKDDVEGFISCTTASDGILSDQPAGIPRCGERNPLAYPTIKSAYEKSGFKTILDKTFVPLGKGQFPAFPSADGTFYAAGSYSIPMEVQQCNKSADCMTTTSLLFEEEGISDSAATGGVWPQRNDKIIEVTEWTEEGQKQQTMKETTFSRKGSATDPDLFNDNPYPENRRTEDPDWLAYVFESSDKKYLLTLFREYDVQVSSDGPFFGARAAGEEWLGGRIQYADQVKFFRAGVGEYAKPAGGPEILFGWRKIVKDGGTARELVLNHFNGRTVIRVGDEGLAEGKATNLIIAQGSGIRNVMSDLPSERPPHPQSPTGVSWDSVMFSQTRLSYGDKDGDGTIDTFGAKGQQGLVSTGAACFTDGVVVRDIVSGTGFSPNYCVRKKSTLTKIGEIAGFAGMVGSFFTGGWGLAIFAVSSATEIVVQHNQEWPDEGVG